MRDRRGSVIDRRSGKDRRLEKGASHLREGLEERRNGMERRDAWERRSGWVRVSPWFSVLPWEGETDPSQWPVCPPAQ